MNTLLIISSGLIKHSQKSPKQVTTYFTFWISVVSLCVKVLLLLFLFLTHTFSGMDWWFCCSATLIPILATLRCRRDFLPLFSSICDYFFTQRRKQGEGKTYVDRPKLRVGHEKRDCDQFWPYKRVGTAVVFNLLLSSF